MIACENGHLANRGRVLFNQAIEHIRSGLPHGWAMEDLAATIQVVAEQVATEYVRYWIEHTGWVKYQNPHYQQRVEHAEFDHYLPIVANDF